MKKRSTKPGNNRKNKPSSPQAVLDTPKPRRKATFKIETLEPRILMSATWVDTDTSAAQSGADSGNDTYTGTTGNDTADGLSGNDILHGGEGNDTLSGSAGDDVLDGGAGSDFLDGGSGTDTADYSSATSGVTVDLGNTYAQNTGGAGTDTLDDIENITGSSHRDTLEGDNSANTISGGAGNDTLRGRDGNDTLLGGAGHDTLKGDDGNDTLSGGDGDDVLKGGYGNDSLDGGAGNDSLRGGSGSDTLSGGEGNDSLKGGSGDDVLQGGAGNDRLDGGSSNDTLDGGDGNDTMQGGSGSDTLAGGAGNDTLKGGSGNDTLDGGEGNDTLRGGSGADLLLASAGNDTLRGGQDNDTFNFANATNGSTYTVSGGSGSDTIDLSTYSASQVQQSTGRIDVSMTGGGSFTIHHSGVENIVVGSGAPAALTDPGEGSDSDSDEGALAVDAGADHAIPAGTGSVSLDAAIESGGDDMTVQWTQIGGPAVTLSNPEGATPTFDAPSVSSPTQLTFQVEVTDGGTTVTDTVVVTINPTNAAPTADDGGLTVLEDAAATSVTLHGTDADAGDSIDHYQIESLPAQGALTLNGVTVTAGQTVTAAQVANGDLKFAPNANFNGSTSFTFRAHDGDALSANVATHTFTVQSQNDGPMASGGSMTLNEDASATAVTLTGTDLDAGDSVEQYRIETVPANGSLTLNGTAVTAGQVVTQAQVANGDLKFAPSADFNGSTSFTYSAHDGESWSASTGTFNVTVNAVEDAPPPAAPVFSSSTPSSNAENTVVAIADPTANAPETTAESSHAHQSDAPEGDHANQPKSDAPTNVVGSDGGSNSTVISDPPGVVTNNASDGDEPAAPPPNTTNSTSAPRGPVHTPPQWNGTEDLRQLDPREGLDGFIAHDPGTVEGTHAESVQAEFEADQASALQPLHEFVLPQSEATATRDFGSMTIPANARFEDVFTESGSQGVVLQFDSSTSDADGFGAQTRDPDDVNTANATFNDAVRGVNAKSLDESAPGVNAAMKLATTGEASQLHDAEALPVAGVQRGDGLFARLWVAVRGLGPTQERENANATNSNRTRT